MKLFKCHNCGQLLYFENTLCTRCEHTLGYLDSNQSIVVLVPTKENNWRSLNDPAAQYRYCANAAHNACNWLLPVDDPNDYCTACQLNRTIPDLGNMTYLLRWQKLEMAKHHLVYSLLRLGLPVVSKGVNPEKGLTFDFLADGAQEAGAAPTITTGHDNGVITINIAEADDAYRTRQQQNLAETYRTLLGHFRHEIAHYYWELMALDTQWLARCREVFGDDRQDYAAAMNAHYTNSAPIDWREHYVTAYATMHPWEDWAESWAHYLHVVDTLETAYAFGLQVDPRLNVDESLTKAINFNAYRQENFDELIDTWLPLTFAINSLNRSMGQPDLYPFILSQPAIEKLRFIHETIRHFKL